MWKMTDLDASQTATVELHLNTKGSIIAHRVDVTIKEEHVMMIFGKIGNVVTLVSHLLQVSILKVENQWQYQNLKQETKYKQVITFIETIYVTFLSLLAKFIRYSLIEGEDIMF